MDATIEVDKGFGMDFLALPDFLTSIFELCESKLSGCVP
jgi:hypothetical protein